MADDNLLNAGCVRIVYACDHLRRFTRTPGPGQETIRLNESCPTCKTAKASDNVLLGMIEKTGGGL